MSLFRCGGGGAINMTVYGIVGMSANRGTINVYSNCPKIEFQVPSNVVGKDLYVLSSGGAAGSFVSLGTYIQRYQDAQGIKIDSEEILDYTSADNYTYFLAKYKITNTAISFFSNKGNSHTYATTFFFVLDQPVQYPAGT